MRVNVRVMGFFVVEFTVEEERRKRSVGSLHPRRRKLRV